MWEIFGLRVWHDDDLAHLDSDDLEAFVAQVKKVHAQRVKESRG